jgi:hypothetical protein
VTRKEKGGGRAQRISSVGVRQTCGVARRQPSKRASAACGGEEGKSRRETGMAAAARAAWGAIGGHSPALRIVRQSRSRFAQLQRLQDRSAAALEVRQGRVRCKKEEGGRRAQRITSVGVCGPAGSLGGSPRKGRRPRAVARKKEGGRRVQRKASVCVRRTCVIARQQPSKEGAAACGGEEGECMRGTGMAAAARAAWGATGGHSPALLIVRQSRSRFARLQRLQDRSAAAL